MEGEGWVLSIVGTVEKGEWRGLLVGCLLNIPATCWCILGTDLHRQVYVLPH